MKTNNELGFLPFAAIAKGWMALKQFGGGGGQAASINIQYPEYKRQAPVGLIVLGVFGGLTLVMMIAMMSMSRRAEN